MIGKIAAVRHAIVIAAIALTSVLAGIGVIGGGRHPERFDAKTVVVEPQGEASIRITEYVDIDFGSEHRHGYERIVPNDFGVPRDVVASSPDADDQLSVVDQGSDTRIRIGDPGVTFTGQHRYVLAYTLPDAHFDELGAQHGVDMYVAVDLVSARGGLYPGDQETGRFEVVVDGFRLDDTRCDVGDPGATGGCRLAEAPDGTFRVVLEPLQRDAGLTVGGTIVGFADPVAIDPPPIPQRRGGGPDGLLIGLGFAALGVAGTAGVYLWARRRGRNEVYAGGAADAAFGSLPPPGVEGATPPVSLVADDEMRDLATIEFAPPRGIAPWEARVLLTERCGDDAVEAWLSGMVADEALDIAEQDRNLVLSSGPRRGDLPAADAQLLSRILDIDDPYVTGQYDRRFASAWSAVHRAQVDGIAHRGWWKRLPPGGGIGRVASSPFGVIVALVFVLVWSGWTVSAFVGAFRIWPIAIAVGLAFPATIAYFVYRVMLPVRSAPGSALALQAESFRRFLHASEARHVEWAWSRGLLREYSAWAVALGEADAWSAALERANVPAPAIAAAGPIIVHTRSSSMRSSRTAPSSSGGGGGGFGGGGVGGGGGGGSSGSW